MEVAVGREGDAIGPRRGVPRRGVPGALHDLVEVIDCDVWDVLCDFFVIVG